MKKLLFILSFCLLLCGCEKSEMEIELEGNPTTGYEWICEIEDSSILIINGTKFEENDSDEKLLGVGGIYKYDFAALSEGETNIIFSYLKRFESGIEPMYKLIYKIKVDSNMKMSVISKEGTYLDKNIPEPKID